MKTKIAKNDIEFQMFADYWKLLEEYFVPENDEKYWEDLLSSVRKFAKKYNSGFAKDLGLSLIDELERKHTNK